MAYRTGAKGGNRNFGLDGPGKGDKDRTSNRQKFLENFSKIKLSGPKKDFTGFKKRGNKFIKKYS